MKIKTFDKYQEHVKELSFVKGKQLPKWVYPAMGLAGEAGEVLEQIKKGIRDTDGQTLPQSRIDNIRLELGDVLFYIGMLAESLGMSMEDIASANIDKLTERKLLKKMGAIV